MGSGFKGIGSALGGVTGRTPGYGDGLQMGGKDAFSDVTKQFGAGAEPAKRGGLFGSGMNGEDFINVLTRAAALANGDYGGAAQIGQLIRKPQMDKQKRDDEFEDWKRQYDYQVQNAKPVNNDTVADYEYILKNLGEEAAKTFLQNKADPPQYRQGPDGQFYRISPTQGATPTTPAAPPSFTDDDWNSGTPLGGAGFGQRGFPGQPPRRRNRGY